MTSHQAQVPPVVADYFGVRSPNDHPIVAQVFRADRGWKRYPIRKRVSRSWAVQARKEGVTDVALTCHGRVADFPIGELLTRKSR